jgi:WD40 repeat protein
MSFLNELAVAWNSDGQVLASGSTDETIKHW